MQRCKKNKQGTKVDTTNMDVVEVGNVLTSFKCKFTSGNYYTANNTSDQNTKQSY
jgi:hypothetical protein